MVVPGQHAASEGQGGVAEAPTNQEPTGGGARKTGHADAAVSHVRVSHDSDLEKKAAPASEKPLSEEKGSPDRGPPTAAADVSEGDFADASDDFGSPELEPPTAPTPTLPGVAVSGTQILPLAAAAEPPSRQVASAETRVDSPEEKRDQAVAQAPFPIPSGAKDTPPPPPPPLRAHPIARTPSLSPTPKPQIPAHEPTHLLPHQSIAF